MVLTAMSKTRECLCPIWTEAPHGGWDESLRSKSTLFGISFSTDGRHLRYLFGDVSFWIDNRRDEATHRAP